MAPFPEAEIMTIKRLEVALRKADFKLLKEGAYKLHEKYHSNHQFEHLDLLKEIYVEVADNPSIPEDTRTILAQTINDIISNQDITIYRKEEETQSFIANIPTEQPQDVKVSAFDVFGAQKQNNQTFTKTIVTQAMNNFVPNNAEVQNQQKQETQQYQTFENKTETFKDLTNDFDEVRKLQENVVNVENAIQEEAFVEETQEETLDEQAVQVEPEVVQEEIVTQEKKSVAIFFGQNSSDEKINNITKLRKIISNANEFETHPNELFDLISEIKIQSNTNVVELQRVLEQLKQNENRTNLITNSQSDNFFELFDSSEISYSLFKEKNKDVNLIPIFGLSNLYNCPNCQEKHIDLSDNIKPLILQCPKCKKAMYPDLYTANKDAQINIKRYNQALIQLATSKVWLLIQPSLNEEITKELIIAAFVLSNSVEEIYILDKDINVRENYKNTFLNIKSDITINTQISALEDFLNCI